MPIYEYRCQKCGEFEFMQKITDTPLKKCPKCRSKVTKLISNTSFQLKGSGWYVTDYGRSGGKPGKGKESSSDGKAESTSAASSDSKSESSKTGGKGKEKAAA